MSVVTRDFSSPAVKGLIIVESENFIVIKSIHSRYQLFQSDCNTWPCAHSQEYPNGDHTWRGWLPQYGLCNGSLAVPSCIPFKDVSIGGMCEGQGVWRGYNLNS